MWKTKKNKVSWRLEFDKSWKLQRVKNYKEAKIKNNKKPKLFDLSWII